MTVYCTNVILHKCILRTKPKQGAALKMSLHLPGKKKVGKIKEVRKKYCPSPYKNLPFYLYFLKVILNLMRNRNFYFLRYLQLKCNI